MFRNTTVGIGTADGERSEIDGVGIDFESELGSVSRLLNGLDFGKPPIRAGDSERRNPSVRNQS